MKKLVFIENRHKTFFFDAIANELASQGHEIYWIIQNKQFFPRSVGEKFVIQYPKKKEIYKFPKLEEVEEIIKSDRQQNHFNKKNTNYFYYYYHQIGGLLKRIEPDFVFGEATAFHELLAIAQCKRMNILYLNPSTCRYPVGRFSFYKYDTLEPYKGSKEILNDKNAEETIDQIVNRRTPPDYMKPQSADKTKIFKDQLKKVYAYTLGESYNTPSPFIKRSLEKEKERNIKLWNDMAVSSVVEDNSIRVLYPLQMQPEANIDVWGREHRDQTKLIQSLSQALPKGTVLYVKPNPKSKYELSNELVKTVKALTNVTALHHKTKMDDVLPSIDLVVTVTGTVAIECILSNIPIVTLVRTLNNEAKNCFFVDSINSELTLVIDTVKKDEFPKLDLKDKIKFINLLNSSSYRGIVSDPFSDINSISSSNLNSMNSAFHNVIQSKNV